MLNFQTFCPPDESFYEIWINGGFSRCFYDTVSTAIPLIIVTTYFTIFFSKILCFHTYFGSSLPVSFKILSKLHIFLLVMLFTIPMIKFGIFLSPKLTNNPAYGYHLFYFLSETIQIILCIVLFKWERYIISKRHSLFLLFFWTIRLLFDFLCLASWNSFSWFWKLDSLLNIFLFIIWICRIFLDLSIFILGLIAPSLPLRYHRSDIQGLLTSESIEDQIGQHPDASSTWNNLKHKMLLLAPTLWPKHSWKLQLVVVICILNLIAGRVVNLFVPITFKHIIDSLTLENNQNASYYKLNDLVDSRLQFRWDLIIFYIFLRSLMGIGSGSGILSMIHNQLWLRVQQYTIQRISIKLFNHLHSLSLNWHLNKKHGEILRIVDRGTDSTNNVLSYILFSIVPTIVDIMIAIVYLIATFNFWFGAIVGLTMLLYLYCTFTITEWRTKYRRKVNQLDKEKNSAAVDSLVNFETVKNFAQEEFEASRFLKAINNYQSAEISAQFSHSLLGLSQNLVINFGFCIGTLLCAYLVVIGEPEFTVGNFVLFSTILMQLYQPLNFFGTYYRLIQTSFVDMENMFELLNIKPDVVDIPNAPDLIVKNGEIEFINVSFQYPNGKLALNNLNLKIKPGQLVAFVGPTGSGKSTILRLINRLYDVSSGSILIDSQDLRNVTQNSLRKAVGVVPQDSVMFNDTIEYNIGYGKISASSEEIETAAKYAEIYQQILLFPNKFQSMVGERGLKLSGGERQRMSIARAIVKSPDIVIFDEATSSLDSATERRILTSLNQVCRNKTTIMVAHRLSTIVDVDVIFVIVDGRLVETGSHAELIAKSPQDSNAHFVKMWNLHLREEDSKNDI